MIRIMGGQYRSRKLREPRERPGLRPYTGRVKESVFNLLRGWTENARVLDLFAGVGTMGLEAISRGAAEALFVEADKDTVKRLEENIAMLGCGDRAQVLHADALGPTALLRTPRPLDMVFVDPPYDMMREETRRSRVLEQIERLRDLSAERCWIVLRAPIGPDDAALEIPGFDGPEPHRYGPTMWVMLYMPGGGSP